MDDKKVIKLNIDNSKKEEPEKKQVPSFSTNPILKKKLVTNANTKKDKFSLKDLLR